jgi:AraC-like DNA-binding protein
MVSWLSKKTYLFFFLLLFFVTACNENQDIDFDTNLRTFSEIPYYSGNIIIDGKTNDWKTYGIAIFADTAQIVHAPEEFSFVATYGLDSSTFRLPKSRNKTKVKSCWNLHGLYFLFEIDDAHLMAEIDDGNDNPKIFLNDGIEIYIDAKFDSRQRMDINDYQFMVDILSNYVVFKGDRRLQDSIKHTVPKDYGQNILIETASSCKGTINDSISDEGFKIEVKIPFEAIGIAPPEGKPIKLDLCNNDNDYWLDDYDLSNLSKVITRPYNWAGLNNFGYPDYWKTVWLTGGPDWFERNFAFMSRQWVLFFLSLSTISITVIVVLFFSIRRMRRIPAFSEVAPSKLIFIKQENSPLPAQSYNQRLLQKATDYILGNSDENTNSEKVAGVLGISLRKLQRLTKEELNCTPTGFIYLVKLNKAAELIRLKTGSIAEIAYSLGFSSPSYFSKIFKEHFGMSPLEYQKSDKSSENSDTSV